MTTDNANIKRCPKCGAVVPADAPQGLCPKCVLAGVASPTGGGAPATATSEIPSLERVAASFPQLEVAELVGRGGMGFVFKARQPHLDRWVALKLLPDKLAKDPLFAERFNREGRVLAKLNHPNIVSVFDFGKTEDFYYLLMEFVDGVNLRQAMHAGRFSPMEALQIVPKICEALQYAHEQGVLHRDIKPENILLDSKGRVKIADFGIAKLVGEDRPEVTLTGTGAALGTPHYMAPEQLESPTKVDHRADIYSLGVVFYEMLTGELPIGRFEPPSARTPVSANVDEVVFRTLERNREKRFQSANEVKTRVEFLTASGAAAASSLQPPVMSENPHHLAANPEPVGRSPHILALVLGLAACAVLPLVFWIFNKGKHANMFHLMLPFAFAVIPAFILTFWLARYFRGRKPAPPPLPLGPHGTLVAASATFSVKAIISAAFAGLAWIVIGAPLLLALIGGGLSTGELVIFGVPGCVCGLVGTIFGWVALSDIRAQAGRLRGLPLAVFGALACPLAGLVLVAVLLPFINVFSSQPSALVRFVAWLVPAGVLTFSLWAIFATARWAGNQPPSRQRGVLKWVFLVLFVLGIGWALSRNPPGGNSLFEGGEKRALGESEPLPDGLIELVALSRHPSDGYWWKPDGTAASEGPFENPGINQSVNAGERGVAFVFRTRGLPPDASAPKIRFDKELRFGGGGGPPANGFYAVVFPGALKQTTVRAGIGYGPWQTLAEDYRTAGSSADIPYGGQRWKIAFRSALEDKEGNTVVNVSFQTGFKTEFEEVRLVAVTAEGKEFPSLRTSKSADHLQATFVKIPLAQIEHFRFQVRPYRWTEFKNVRLEPAAGIAVAGKSLAQTGVEPLRASFKVPKGQVAVFTLSRHQGGERQEFPEMAGFVVAQDDEAALGEVLLVPQSDDAQGRAQQRWTMKLATEESPQVVVGSEALGALRPLPGARMPLRLPQPEPPNRSLEMQLAQAAGPGGARGEMLVLGVEYTVRPRNLVVGTGAMIGGGTNWENVLNLAAAMDAMNPNKNLAAEIKVRFTMTGVNIREDAGARWLCLDYVANVDTNWVPVFRAEGDRFAVDTRTKHLMEGIAGTVSVRHERAEIKLPAAFSAAEAEELAKSLTVSMVAQPFDVKAGLEAPVFRGPLGDLGMLEAAIGAVPAANVPAVRIQFTKVEIWQEGRRFCLGFDYTLAGSGAMEFFRLVGPQDDASITSGSTKFERQLGNNRPPEVTYRSTLTLPEAVDEKAARALRQRAADAWVGKSLELPPGKRQELLEWTGPGGAKSTLSVEGRLLSIYSNR